MIGWDEATFGLLHGVARSFVSRVEAGRRPPSPEMVATQQLISAARQVRSIEIVDRRGRRHNLPAQRWEPSHLTHVPTMWLPIRLDWTRRRSHDWHLADKRRRASLATIVVSEGNAVDIVTLLDPDWVIEAQDLLPRDLRQVAEMWRK